MAIIQFLNGIDAISRICQAYCDGRVKAKFHMNSIFLMNHPSISFHTLGGKLSFWQLEIIENHSEKKGTSGKHQDYPGIKHVTVKWPSYIWSSRENLNLYGIFRNCHVCVPKCMNMYEWLYYDRSDRLNLQIGDLLPWLTSTQGCHVLSKVC